MSQRGTFRRGFAFAGLTFFATSALSLASGIVTARMYGVTVIGEVALVYAPTGAVWFLSSIREQPALIRALAPLEPRAPRVTGLFAAVFAFSSALTIVVSLVAGAVAVVALSSSSLLDRPSLVAPMAVTLAAYVILENPSWNLDTIFAAFRAGTDIFWVRFDQGAVYLVAAVAIGLRWPTVWGLTVALLFSWFTALVHRIWVVRGWMRFRVPRTDIRDGFAMLPSMLRFGMKMTPGFLAYGASFESGTWILGSIGSIQAVGAWNRSWMLSKRLLDVNGRITDMLFPTLVERRTSGDASGYDRALIDSMRYLAIAMCLPAAAAGGASRGVMAIFGPGFAIGSSALAVLLLVPVLSSLSSLQTQAFLAEDRPLATTYFEVGRTILTVAAGIALAEWKGLVGMACAVVIGCAVQLALQTRSLERHLDGGLQVAWPVRNMLALPLAYAAGFGASWGVFTAIGGYAGTFAGLVAGSLTYVALFALLGGVLPRDRERIAQVIQARRDRSDSATDGSSLDASIAPASTIGNPSS
jgi:O-antigen/teichoic acid export membrane protein